MAGPGTPSTPASRRAQNNDNNSSSSSSNKGANNAKLREAKATITQLRRDLAQLRQDAGGVRSALGRFAIDEQGRDVGTLSEGVTAAMEALSQARASARRQGERAHESVMQAEATTRQAQRLQGELDEARIEVQQLQPRVVDLQRQLAVASSPLSSPTGFALRDGDGAGGGAGADGGTEATPGAGHRRSGRGMYAAASSSAAESPLVEYVDGVVSEAVVLLRHICVGVYARDAGGSILPSLVVAVVWCRAAAT